MTLCLTFIWALSLFGQTRQATDSDAKHRSVPHSGSTPKLLVAIAVGYDYLERFASFETGGLHRLFSEGASFSNAHYHHIPTETGPGHSIMLSGRNPHLTGIISNEWYDRQSGKMLYVVGDSGAALLGDPGGPGASPANFHGEDTMRLNFLSGSLTSITVMERRLIKGRVGISCFIPTRPLTVALQNRSNQKGFRPKPVPNSTATSLDRRLETTCSNILLRRS
jgi:hypothetical protein